MQEDTPVYNVIPKGEPISSELSLVPSNPMQLLAVAVDRDLDIEKMRALMDMDKEYRGEQAKSAYNAAIAKFAGMKMPIRKNETGAGPGGSKFNYADYAQIVDTITPWLKKCGLSFDHKKDPPEMEGKRITMQMVRCWIKHKDGHSEEFSFPAIIDYRLDGKLSPVQLLQAAVTYAKRQSLCDGLGLSTQEETSFDVDSVGGQSRAPVTAKPVSAAAIVSAAQVRMMKTAAEKKNLDEKTVCVNATADTAITSFDKVPFGALNDVLNFIGLQA